MFWKTCSCHTSHSNQSSNSVETYLLLKGFTYKSCNKASVYFKHKYVFMFKMPLISVQFSFLCLHLKFFPINLIAPSSLLFLIGFFNILGINIVFKLDFHISVIYQVVASSLQTFKVTEHISNRNMFSFFKVTWSIS